MAKMMWWLMMLTALIMPAVWGVQTDALPEGAPPLREAVETFRRAYFAWDGAGMQQAVDVLQAANAIPDATFAGHYWEAVARLHLRLHQTDRGADAAHDFRGLDAAFDAVERALDRCADHGELLAIRGTLQGQRIAASRFGGIRYGRAFRNDLARALEVAPDNPRVRYLSAMALLHAPASMGGPDAARRHLAAAVAAFSAEAESRTPDNSLAPFWGWGTALAWHGRLAMERGEQDIAVNAFQNALRVHPGHRLALAGLRQLGVSPAETPPHSE